MVKGPLGVPRPGVSCQIAILVTTDHLGVTNVNSSDLFADIQLILPGTNLNMNTTSDTIMVFTDADSIRYTKLDQIEEAVEENFPDENPTMEVLCK